MVPIQLVNDFDNQFDKQTKPVLIYPSPIKQPLCHYCVSRWHPLKQSWVHIQVFGFSIMMPTSMLSCQSFPSICRLHPCSLAMMPCKPAYLYLPIVNNRCHLANFTSMPRISVTDSSWIQTSNLHSRANPGVGQY